MAFDPTDSTYQELLDRVLQTEGRVVPFVGAGLSAYGDPDQRLPLWGELLEHLIAEGRHLGLIPAEGDATIDAALESGRYIEATDRILEALGEPTFRRAVERELDENGKPIPPAVAELVAISWSLIVTTNLDRMIARAYLERHGRPMNSVTSLDTHKLVAALAGNLTSSETALAQIHGDIDMYPSWRLTRSHYDQLLQDPGYIEALKHLFLRQVFFIGFGLQDDDFDFLLQTIARIYRAGAGEIYALIARSRMHEPAVQQLVKGSGLRPIYYDVESETESGSVDPFGGHRAVFECLSHMSEIWAATQSKLDITLKYFPERDPYMVGRGREIELLAELLMGQRGCVVQLVGLGGSGKTSLVQQFLVDQRHEIEAAGFRKVFGCSLYRADIAQFVQDLALATVRPAAEPLPQCVERICDYVSGERILLILDGVEVMLDDQGKLRNPYVLRIVESVLRGGGVAILTSRIAARGGIFESSQLIEVSPLGPAEILAFLNRWGLNGLDDAAKRHLGEITAGHPLALRILAGMLMDVPEREAIATIERSSVIDISNEVDPLSENRLARVIGSYLQHLNEAEVTFLTCCTAFEGPVPYPLVEATLSRRYPDTSVNAELHDRDLQPIVESLIRRRLLTVGADAELSSHPTVREYFGRRARELPDSLLPLHRFLAARFLEEAEPTPENFEEAAPLLVAARHAAACQEWTLFDDVFRRRLMRGSRQYLCNNLGAWEEGLALARLGDVPSFPAAATSEPAYYPATIARCLKHLGRSAESRAKYLGALEVAARFHDPDTAKYVNNFLTLLIWRGELNEADQLVELNIRAMSWIEEDWKRRWQIEHGFATFAYLRLLQGGTESASKLFDFAAQAWDRYDGERPWMYDNYPYYQGELILLEDPAGHGDALERIDSLLAVAKAQRWPESICRGDIQAAAIYLDRADQMRAPADLVRADQRLDQAQQIPAGMNLPDVTISHMLARLKAELVHQGLYRENRLDHKELGRSLDRLDLLVESSGLALVHPEVVAARGVSAYLRGDVEGARSRYDRALEECRHQGNVLAIQSRRSFIYWLGQRIGSSATIEVAVPDDDLVGLVGSTLDPDWMLDRLRDQTAAPRCYHP